MNTGETTFIQTTAACPFCGGVRSAEEMRVEGQLVATFCTDCGGRVRDK